MNAPAELPGRTARIERKTAETEIAVEIDLDGSGRAQLATGVPFLDHMKTPEDAAAAAAENPTPPSQIPGKTIDAEVKKETNKS